MKLGELLALGFVGVVGVMVFQNWKVCQTSYYNISKTGVRCAENDVKCASGGTIGTEVSSKPNLSCLLNPFPGGL
jgi:hypothetical protein